jgi:transposase
MHRQGRSGTEISRATGLGAATISRTLKAMCSDHPHGRHGGAAGT